MSDFSNLPTSRVAAVAARSKRFYTGRPCAQGHDVPRLTSNYGCVKCLSLNAKEYMRTTRAKLRGEPA